MREALIILAVIAVLIALTAFKYRRQIGAVIEVWRTLKKLQGVRKDPAEVGARREAAGPLVSCARCKAWVPEEKAIRLGKTMTYCSTACLERSATPV